MLLPRREIKWSEKYKLRPLLSRLVGALQATLLTNKEKKQQMENKWRRTKKEVKTEFTTAVMLLPARLRQFNGSLICFCDPAIVSAYIQTSGSLKLFFLRRRCLMSITLFHKFGEMTQSVVSSKHINMGCRNLFKTTCRGRPSKNMLGSWWLRSNPNMSQS